MCVCLQYNTIQYSTLCVCLQYNTIQYSTLCVCVCLQESSSFCAKKVILALPPPALRDIEWKKFSADKDDANDVEAASLREGLGSLEVVPSLVAYFVYNKKWWREYHEPWMQDILTDLPLKRVRYVGEIHSQPEFGDDEQSRPEYGPQTARHLFMVANFDASDYDYFASLVTSTVYDGFIKASCTNTSHIVRDVTRQLAAIYGVKERDIPAPESLYIVDWSRMPSGGGRFMWKTGVWWDSMARRLQRPRTNQKVFVVGDAYCPGQCQLWAEGALQTVQSMLTAYTDILLRDHVKDSYR